MTIYILCLEFQCLERKVDDLIIKREIPYAFHKYTAKYYVSKYAIQTLATYLMAQGHLCYHQEALNAG